MFATPRPALVLSALLLVPAALSAQVPPPGASPLPSGWSRAADELGRAWSRGDAVALSRLLASGATLHEGGTTTTRPGEVVLRWISGDARRVSQRRSVPERATAQGDAVLESGRFERWEEPRDCLVPTGYDPKGGPAALRSYLCAGPASGAHHALTRGEYQLVWRRGADGAWRVERVELAPRR